MNFKMRARSAMLLALFLLGAVTGYKIKSHRITDKQAEAHLASVASDLAEVRDLILALEPKLRTKHDDLQTAILLRNFVHQRIPLYSALGVEKYGAYDFHDIDSTFMKSILDDRYGHKCGGFVIEYLVALKAFGLTARKVGMYPEVVNLPQVPISHASVGVLINGKWVAQDPYFNISLRSAAGQRIGWFDIPRLKHATPDHDGYDSKLSFEQFAKKIDVATLTQHMNADDAIWPSGWDGILRYKAGHTFDAATSDRSGIYDDLN